MKLWYILAVCCALLAACGNGDSKTADTAEAHERYKPKMGVDVKVEGNKATVTVDTDMKISPEHYGQARKEGEGHIHMYLNNGDKIGVKDGIYVFNDLPPGTYTLKISLHNNDHTPYDVTDLIHFDIK
ncbi:carboxypeptidase-like regulatory domain-containing protein [Paenibacillus gansuensis]|uniref:Carboxypeptidase-like regulatory domain-containing protein n=1 Tax=Paenibacillus gansuensis TaxID=306542 RepID=A0ABW5P7E6_9BACL